MANHLEQLLRENKLKEFFRKIHENTQVKIPTLPVRGIESEDGTLIMDEQEI